MKKIAKKTEYLVTKQNLKKEKEVVKKEVSKNILSFKSHQKQDYEQFLKTQPLQEEKKVKKRSQISEFQEYSNLEKKKLVRLNTQIKDVKQGYTNEIDTNWKMNHVKQVELKKPIYVQSTQSAFQKYDEKIQKQEQSFQNKIDIHKVKISELRKEIEDSQLQFIRDYKKESNYYQAEFLTIQNWKFVEKRKVKIRFLRRRIRDLQDEHDAAIKRIQAKKEKKIAKLENKYINKLEFNRPLSKLFWVNQIMGGINRGSTKFDQQRHMYAIKMGLIYIMPITLVAAFWILMNSVILSTNNGGFLYLIGIKEASEGLKNFQAIGGLINNITLGIMGVVLSVTISGVLGNRLGINPFESAVVGMSSFFAFLPTFVVSMTGNGTPDTPAIKIADLGSNSMFLAIITSLVGIELYNWLLKSKYLKIKMPAQIPPAVARSFNVIIPFFLVTFLFASISFSLLHFANKNLPELIQLAVAQPLSAGIESLGGVVLIRLIADGLWCLGIHGQNMIGPIVSPIYVAHLTENAELVAQGLAPKWIVTSTFMDSYTLMQDNLLVVISLFLFSKRKDHLAIMTVAAIPAIFKISEPVMFGLPIILNPILAIPLLLGSLLMAIIGYFVIYWHWATPLYIMTPWTTPPFLDPWLASGGDYRNLLLAFGLAFVGIGTYCPFIILANKQAAQYNPDLIVKRFSFQSKTGMRKHEAQQYLQELQEKNYLKSQEIKHSPLISQQKMKEG